MFNGIVTKTGIIIRATNVVTVVTVSLRAHHSFASLSELSRRAPCRVVH